MATTFLTTEILSHAQKVCRLYREGLRTIKSHHGERHIYRYHATVLRARFDANRDEPNVMEAKRLLEEGEVELYKKAHPQPFKWGNSPGGSAYGRDHYKPDWIVDMWHPLERAQYPEYFARRDQRKQEHIERWEKQYGKPTAETH